MATLVEELDGYRMAAASRKGAHHGWYRPRFAISSIARRGGVWTFDQAFGLREVALPIDRVFPLARAIRCDRAELFKLPVKDWRLERTLLPMLEALEEFKATEGELLVLNHLRQRLDGRELVVTAAVIDWAGTFPNEEE